jgi:hypothetical protein
VLEKRRSKQERQKLNQAMAKQGLATLDDPRGFLNQTAFIIQNHVMFRRLLTTVEPQHRQECYDALSAKLSFKPKPLDVYLAEAGEIAEREQWDIIDSRTGEIKSAAAAHIDTLAQQAIRQNKKAEQAKGSLELVCKRCTVAAYFLAMKREQAYEEAQSDGWTFEIAGEEEKAICPKCSIR